MATKTEKREESLRAILDAALELFVTKGYTETTVADIAARAGLAPATIYYYFGTKRDLAVQLADSLSRELVEQEWFIVAGGGCARDKIHRLVKHFYDWVAESPLPMRYLYGPEITKVTEGDRSLELSSTPYHVLTRLLSEGRAAGEIKDLPDSVLLWAFSIALDFAMTRATAGQEKQIGAHAFNVAEMIWRAVSSDCAILQKLQGATGEEKGGESAALTKD